MDTETVVGAVAIAGLVALGGLLYWLILVDTVSRGRLMRCPEIGSVNFVRIAPAAGGEGKTSGVTVTHCDLWPGRKDCKQGCLARFGETAPGLRGSLDALRPFEPQQ